MSLSFDVKYTPIPTQPSDAETLAFRLESKIRTAMEHVATTGYGRSNVKVDRTDTGFRVTVIPGGIQSSSGPLDGEAREMEPGHDIEEISPVNDQTLLASMSETVLSQMFPSILQEVLTILKSRRSR